MTTSEIPLEGNATSVTVLLRPYSLLLLALAVCAGTMLLPNPDPNAPPPMSIKSVMPSMPPLPPVETATDSGSDSDIPASGTDTAPAASERQPAMTGSPLAAELNAPGADATEDVEALHGLIRQYLHQMHHRQGIPIGDDIDLARVLTGHNPMKLALLPAGHTALSADGHIKDRWDTPYFIHPLGRNAFEVRSAGPDRKLFTDDDISSSPGRQESEQ